MPVSLLDGSLVGDGSQIGMFPVLADQPLEKPSTLLRSSANPRMDLVLLIVKDAASPSAAAAAPPGMSAAQFALVQRMLAARQRGAQAAGAQGVPEPKRGPQIHLVLWRMGDDSSVVWSVVLSWDKVMDPPHGAAGAAQQEHEDVHLHDLAWSPKGDRVGVLASVRRSPVASTSAAAPRTKTFLRTYSVQDGRLLSTVRVGQYSKSAPSADQFADAMTLQWLDIDFGVSDDAVDGSSEALLTKLPPLPALPAADTFATAGGTGNLMPHQLRMMQMSGQKPPPSFQFPSQLALQGRGPLAAVPCLAKADADLGLLEGGEAALALDEDKALPLSPESVVLVSRPHNAQVNLVLDGQIDIGALQLPQSAQEVQEPEDAPSSPTYTLSLSRDMTRLLSLSAMADTTVTLHRLELPLASTSSYGPTDVRRRIASVSRSSHLLRLYLGYALDTASALQQVFQKELAQKVTSEWTKNIDDLSIKFGGDMKYELINVLLTGRAAPAAEQFLLGNLTEGVLTRLEQQAHTALYALKKLIWESLRPALERCIIALSGLVGQTRFFGGDDKGLREAMKWLQEALRSTLSLATEVDTEAVVSQEFYRWCRIERERQERIKQDQDEPRLAITNDVHTVANYIERGFENGALQTMLGNAAVEGLLSGTGEQKISLQEALASARAFLTSASGSSEKAGPKEEERELPIVPIAPTLLKAIETLGEQLAQMLDGSLETAAGTQTGPHTAASGGLLVQEPAPALSLSSSVDAAERSSRTLTTSFVDAHTCLSAHALRSNPDDSTSRASVLAVRCDDADLVFAHFTVATPEPLSILDLGLYADSELLVLARLATSSTSVLLAFAISNLPFSSSTDQEPVALTPTRATEFESDFHPASLAVNANKQTVAVLGEDGRRVVYLDVSFVEVGGESAMQEDV